MGKTKPILIFAVLLLSVFVIYLISSGKTKTTLSHPPITQATQENKNQSSVQPSGDATIKLTITRKDSSANSVFTFKVTDTQTDISRTVFEVTENRNVSYSIPGNSWSPDNKQFFVSRSDSGVSDYLVFKADGTEYTDGQKYLKIGDYWSKTKYNLKIQTVTGWAGPDLLVVYTTSENGEGGPSFWFVTGSMNFMQLSS